MNKRTEAGEINFNLRGLLDIQTMTAKLQRSEIHVGVLGDDKNSRTDGGPMTNSEIGAVHEYGSKTRNIPRRSFLGMPMTLHFGPALNQQADAIVQIFIVSGLMAFLRAIAIVAEQIIDKAFETSGWGMWPKNSPGVFARKFAQAKKNNPKSKPNPMPLIDTGQLRNSIASRILVKENT